MGGTFVGNAFNGNFWPLTQTVADVHEGGGLPRAIHNDVPKLVRPHAPRVTSSHVPRVIR